MLLNKSVTVSLIVCNRILKCALYVSGEVAPKQMKLNKEPQWSSSQRLWLKLFKKPPVWYNSCSSFLLCLFYVYLSRFSECRITSSLFPSVISSSLGQWYLPTCVYAALPTRYCHGCQHTSKNLSHTLRYLFSLYVAI